MTRLISTIFIATALSACATTRPTSDVKFYAVTAKGLKYTSTGSQPVMMPYDIAEQLGFIAIKIDDWKAFDEKYISGCREYK